ncbi:MAG: hypothetical protein ACREBE_00305 [bacterium]
MSRSFRRSCIVLAAVVSACHARAFTNAPPLGEPPPLILGDFEDDYGGRHTVSASEWIQGRDRYRIVRWDAAGQYLVAQNDSGNHSAAGKWTRIDWMSFSDMAPYDWGFCFTAYEAATRTAAEATTIANRASPRTGCNGFPFSRMRRRPSSGPDSGD